MSANVDLNARPDYDRVLQTLADYALTYRVESAEALDTARNCLMDTLGCGLLALRFPECTKLLGPQVEGTLVPNGARVPGTAYRLDPVKAAWDIGCTVRWLDYNDTWLAAEWAHPSDNLGGILAVADHLSQKRVAAGEAPLLMRDVLDVLERHFWEEGPGLYRDEWNRDWTPFSTYRGMNANMHGAEALLAAHEATGEAVHLERAGRILDTFTARIAPAEGWRIPEHYSEDWQIDRAYAGNPMFRPAGTTPGHSFEFARLLLQWWDLSGRRGDAPGRARALAQQAMADGWLPDTGGIAYTLDFGGRVAIADRYWWPVTEAIGTVAMLQKADPREGDEDWYRKLWHFAEAHFVDHARGGWFPEIGVDGKPASTLFAGKPDIYHSIQAALFPLTSGVSRHFAQMGAI